jgi:hypothetical protein
MRNAYSQCGAAAIQLLGTLYGSFYSAQQQRRRLRAPTLPAPQSGMACVPCVDLPHRQHPSALPLRHHHRHGQRVLLHVTVPAHVVAVGCARVCKHLGRVRLPVLWVTLSRDLGQRWWHMPRSGGALKAQGGYSRVTAQSLCGRAARATTLQATILLLHVQLHRRMRSNHPAICTGGVHCAHWSSSRATRSDARRSGCSAPGSPRRSGVDLGVQPLRQLLVTHRASSGSLVASGRARTLCLLLLRPRLRLLCGRLGQALRQLGSLQSKGRQVEVSWRCSWAMCSCLPCLLRKQVATLGNGRLH